MDDLISRQAAIDALDGELIITGRENAKTIRDYINGIDKKLRELPSAERRGRWEFNIDDKGWSWDKPYMCDQCGEWVEKIFKFCPNCGAKMEAKENEND